MKFQKFIRDAEQRTAKQLRHLNYKLLKAEIRRLRAEVESGSRFGPAEAAVAFEEYLSLELQAVSANWDSQIRHLRDQAEALFQMADVALTGDIAHTALGEPDRPLKLLEPLDSWLKLAAWADALRRHRLLQVTAAVKIEKKFAKAIGYSLGLRPGAASATWEMLRSSSLGDTQVHDLCRQLEAACDALLRLGLGSCRSAARDPCPVCLEDVVDPCRLPCGHRFCVHCVLPLFNRASYAGGISVAMLPCPLCRAAGPGTPQALVLDTLLSRMERGLSRGGFAKRADEEYTQQLTAVVVTSLTRLAAQDACIDRDVSSSSDELAPTACQQLPLALLPAK